MDLDTKGCNVFLFEFSGQMTLDKGCLLEHVSNRVRQNL